MKIRRSSRERPQDSKNTVTRSLEGQRIVDAESLKLAQKMEVGPPGAMSPRPGYSFRARPAAQARIFSQSRTSLAGIRWRGLAGRVTSSL